MKTSGNNCLFQILDKDQIEETDLHVIDGGSLMRQIKWNEKSTFAEIVVCYINFVNSKYGISTVVFDGYDGGPSPKDHEHARRGNMSSPEFIIRRDSKLTVSQQSFLTNSSNKSGLLKLLITQLLIAGHTVKQADADADKLIVETVLQAAREGRSVTVFANDTDVIVMLLHHWSTSMASIVVRSEIKQRSYTVTKQMNIEEASGMLTPNTKNFLLFSHAFGGCDTTSGIHEKGKGSVVRLIEKSKEAQEIAEKFMDKNMSQDDIGNAGHDMFVLLYGGKLGDQLASLRHRNYMRMAAAASTLNPSKLPPTKRTAYFHSLRVKLQVNILDYFAY